MKKLTEYEKNQIIELTNQNLSANQIAKILNRGTATIERFWRKNGLHSKFNDIYCVVENHKDEIIKLINKGMSDLSISKTFNCSKTSIYLFRKKYKVNRESLRYAKNIELSPEQKEILIGSLLGDSSLILHKGSKFPYFSTSHSEKQKEYVNHINEKFLSPGARIKKCTRNQIRKDGTQIQVYSCITRCNQQFLPIYNQFYINKKKVIPFELLNTTFTAKSLTYLFMDDGWYSVNSISLSLCGFEEKELDSFIQFLYDKFDLTFTKNKHFNKHYNKSYISIRLISSDFNKFKKLISPYIQKWALYKLGGS